MDAEPGELLGGSGVASAAGGENALLRDGARRVGLGLDLVPVVTTRADRGLGVAEQESLAVVAVEVGRLATAVTTHAQVHDALAEGQRAGHEDVVGVVAIGAERRLGVVALQSELAVEGTRVRHVGVRVAVAAGRDLGRLEPVLCDLRRVHAGVEPDVATDAGELTVRRCLVLGLVDVEALALAVDGDVLAQLLAGDVDVDVRALLAVTREALVVERGGINHPASGAGGGGGQGGNAKHRRCAEESPAQSAAQDRHRLTPLFSWQASHMPWGWQTRQALGPLAETAPCVFSQSSG